MLGNKGMILRFKIVFNFIENNDFNYFLTLFVVILYKLVMKLWRMKLTSKLQAITDSREEFNNIAATT